MRWTPRSLLQQLGMTAQLIRLSMPFHSKVVAPASGPLYPAHLRDGDRLPAHPLVGNIDGDSTRPMTWTPSSGAWLTRWRPRSSSSRASRLATEKGRAFSSEVGPKRALMALAESILEDKDDVICFSTNHPSAAGCVPSTKPCAASTLRAFPAPKISCCCGSDAARSCRTSRRATPVQASIPTSRTEHPRP